MVGRAKVICSLVNFNLVVRQTMKVRTSLLTDRRTVSAPIVIELPLSEVFGRLFGHQRDARDVFSHNLGLVRGRHKPRGTRRLQSAICERRKQSNIYITSSTVELAYVRVYYLFILIGRVVEALGLKPK
jgi:hypothetical protein